MRLFTGEKYIRSRGFGLVEILIAAAIVTAATVSFGQVAKISLEVLRAEKNAMQAAFLVEEGIEGIRALRDAGWDANIAPLSTSGTTYYLATTTGGAWQLTAVEPPFIDGRYQRTITFGSVWRSNSDDQVAPSGTGYQDPGTRQATTTVLWRNKNATTSVQAVVYLTDFLQN
jgi:type II secretory pathway pseudopilin PulG